MSDENVQNAEPKQQTQDSSIANSTVNQTEDQQQINWKKFREARENERKQREDAERRAAQKEAEAEALKLAMDALLNKSSGTNDKIKSSEGYDSEMDDDDEHKVLDKKIEAALASREKKLAQEREAREKAELPNRLKSNFSDFDSVCTEENLDYLEFHHPEIASAFKYMPDGIEKWSSIYKSVKKLVPHADVGNKQKIERNLSKPQSASSSGITQTGDTAPVMLNDKRRAENWARMQRVMKGQ